MSPKNPFKDPNFFWRNFRLGTELSLSGNFIYNGIYHFDSMRFFYYEEECFEVLYNLAIGIERLLKIVIVLSEHDMVLDQGEFEKSLITHNHLELLKRVEQKHKLNLGKVHYKYLSMLLEFYKTTRYERFNISSVYNENSDRTRFVNFFEEHLGIKISIDMSGCTEIDDRMKRFLGEITGKICSQLYEIVRSESYRNRTFTYEIAYDTKAFKIFIAKKFDFYEERMMQREVLLYLIKSSRSEVVEDFLNEVEPLPFDGYDFNEYCKSMMFLRKSRSILGEFLSIAEDGGYPKERIDHISFIGSNSRIEPYDFEWMFEEE